jgi:hypothetical protein
VAVISHTSNGISTMSDSRYDIVGDIHGHADPLRRLLQKLGYTEENGIYRHSSRTILFVGDFIAVGRTHTPPPKYS